MRQRVVNFEHYGENVNEIVPDCICVIQSRIFSIGSLGSHLSLLDTDPDTNKPSCPLGISDHRQRKNWITCSGFKLLWLMSNWLGRVISIIHIVTVVMFDTMSCINCDLLNPNEIVKKCDIVRTWNRTIMKQFNIIVKLKITE